MIKQRTCHQSSKSRFRHIRNHGSFSVIVGMLALMVLLPLGLFTFEVGRMNLAQKQLKAVTDSAALAGAVRISSSPSANAAQVLADGKAAGLMYAQRNTVCGRSLQPLTMSSTTETDTPVTGAGTFDLTYDKASGIVTAKAAFGIDPSFGVLLGLGSSVIRGSSKATVTSGVSDIVLLFDYSDSMMNGGDSLTPAKNAAAGFVQTLNGTNAHIGLSYFAGGVERKIPLSKTADNIAAVKTSLENLSGTKSGTNTGDALKDALNQFNGAGHRSEAGKIIILFTDGLARKPGNLSTGTAHALNIASQCGAQGITIHGIGFFHSGSATEKAQGKNFMEQLKTTAGGDSEFYFAATVAEMEAIMGTLNVSREGIALVN